MRSRPDDRPPDRAASTPAEPLDEPTPREREVVSLLAEGHSNSAIARKLVLSDRTIETHARQVFHKLGLTTHAETHQRVLAVLAYLRTNS